MFATLYFVVLVPGLPAVPCSSFKSWRIVSLESKTCSLRCRNGRPLPSINALQKQLGYINHLWLIFRVCGDPDRALHKNSHPFCHDSHDLRARVRPYMRVRPRVSFLRFILGAIRHLNRCVYSVITALMKRESGSLAHLECVSACACVWEGWRVCQVSAAVCQTDSPIRRGGGLVHCCGSGRTIRAPHAVTSSLFLCACVKLFNGSLCNGLKSVQAALKNEWTSLHSKTKYQNKWNLFLTKQCLSSELKKNITDHVTLKQM